MAFRFICPSTGHMLEASVESDDENDLSQLQPGRMQCSFCGGSHEWVYIASTQDQHRKSRPKRLRS